MRSIIDFNENWEFVKEGKSVGTKCNLEVGGLKGFGVWHWQMDGWEGT